MGTAVLDQAPVFSVQDSVIDEMAAEYMVLAVDDPSDKQQLAVVKEAWQTVRDTRIAVEKRRVELKADALAYGRQVDAEAKRLTEKLEPIEAHLQYHKDAAKREEDRLAAEREAKLQERFKERKALLIAADFRDWADDLEWMADDEFDALLVEQQTAQRERAEKAAAEAEARRVEAERLAADRAELDRLRAAQEAETARQAAEQKRLDDERAKVDAAAAKLRHEQELEKARQEAAEKAARDERERAEREAAAEKARIEREAAEAIAKAERDAAEAKARAEREAAEAKAKAEREEAERLRREAAKPDSDKLVTFANSLSILPCPVLSGVNKRAEADVCDLVAKLVARINTIAEKIKTGDE